MKRIIRLTESDLNRIVRRVIMEQDNNVSSGTGRKNVANKKDTLRAITDSGSIDYNYITNNIPLNELHILIYDAMTFGEGQLGNSLGGDDEAVVEAAFYRILKEPNPKKAFDEVSRRYEMLYDIGMWRDIQSEINVFNTYLKEKGNPSIKALYDQIQEETGTTITPTPANDKLCYYTTNGPDVKPFWEDKIVGEWGFKNIKTFQKWCKKDAGLYFFKNKNNRETKNMCGEPDGKIGCCTITCASEVKNDENLWPNIADHSIRANKIY